MKPLRKRDEKQVASVAVFRDGKLLWGLRRDNGKWSQPGGHLNPGEEPLDGAIRELREETGLAPNGGEIETLGDAEVPGKGIRVYSFRCEAAGDPVPTQDPDSEFKEFRWLKPEDTPADEDLHVPRGDNVTLRYLGLGEPFSCWECGAEPGVNIDCGTCGQSLFKATRYWRSADGLRIPHHQSPERQQWDLGYRQKLGDYFGTGGRKLVDLRLPIESLAGSHHVQGAVGAGGRDRRKFYRRMLAGGDSLPPVVVQRSGNGYRVVDGNARLEAAQAHGLTHLDAVEVRDAVKKSELLRKARKKELFPGSVSQGPRPEIPGAEHVRAVLDRLHTEIDHRYNHLHENVKSLGLDRSDVDTGDEDLIPRDCKRCKKFPLDQNLIGHCTSTAALIAGPLKGRVLGYSHPGDVGPELGEREGGHDFALVDNRYLADWWANSYYNKPDLWDLKNPEHLKQVHKLYGKPSTWAPIDDVVLQGEPRTWVRKSEDLEKSLTGALAAGVMALSSGGALPPQPKPVSAVAATHFPTWTPEGLHQGLIPIAHLESSFGTNVRHQPHTGGEYHSALGALGLKPVTAHEEYRRNASLQKQYPGIEDPADFTARLKHDPRFYNLVASSHWHRLLGQHGSPEKAAYAWRHGSAAARAATAKQIGGDTYVQKYRHLAASAGLGKVETVLTDLPTIIEDLQKMAIAAIKPGPQIPVDDGAVRHDYSHHLPAALQKKYSLWVQHRYGGEIVQARLVDKKTGDRVGHIDGGLEGGGINPAFVDLHPSLRGKGIGKAMYEAFYSHGLHKLGAKKVVGDFHSSMAHNVHRALGAKHGLRGYDPSYLGTKTGDAPGPNDEAYGHYEYNLKAELQKMASPGPLFPKLGVADDRRETDIVTTPRQHEIKARAMAQGSVRGHNALHGKQADLGVTTQAFLRDRSAGMAPAMGPNNSAFSRGHGLRSGFAALAQSPEAPGATQLHENLHLGLKRISDRYGMDARKELVDNIHRHIREQDPMAYLDLRHFISARYPGVNSDPNGQEEHLTTLLNFLNNPRERSAYAEYRGFSEDERRGFESRMKRAYRHFRDAAAQADESWLRPRGGP